MSSYSYSWNERQSVFIARYKKVNGGGWGTKQIPKRFARTQEVDAEHWLIDWYNSYIKTFGINSKDHQVDPTKKTLLTLNQRWLNYREKDPGTKLNTYTGFKNIVKNWILDSNINHYSIQNHDLEKDFSPEECIKWITSLTGARTSITQYVIAIRAFFNDSIALGWIDNNMANPFDNIVVRRHVKKIRDQHDNDKIITYLPVEDFHYMMGSHTPKIYDYRKIRYLVAIGTGMRDHEIQGLTIRDLYLSGTVESKKIPFIDVNKQLDKRGIKPFKKYEDLVAGGMSKDEIKTCSNALMSNPKRNSKRLIPLHPLLIKVLDYWIKTGWKLYVGRSPEMDDPVFPVGKIPANRFSSAGSFAHSDSPELLRKDLERCGLSTTCKNKPLVFHSLRHSFSTYLSNAGIEESRISILLGHVETTTAAKHYVSKQVEQNYVAVVRLPMPEIFTLRSVKFSADQMVVDKSNTTET